MIALGFNACVPIHLAFDLAHALGAEHEEREDAGEHDVGRRLLALLTGHHHHSGGRSHHRPADCAVVGSLGTLGGFAPAADAMSPVPVLAEAPAAVLARTTSEPHGAPPLAYRSRAPPLS